MTFLKPANENINYPLQTKPPLYFNLLMVNLKRGKTLKILIQLVDGKQTLSSGIGE